MIKVLLISPRDPDHPGDLKFLMGGENTYTQLLLKYPPRDVTFIHFEQAIKNGLISYNWKYYSLLWLQKLRILPPGPRAQLFNIHTHFDLVYSHAYPAMLNKDIPLVISDSSSNIVFLKYYLHFSRVRIILGQKIKKVLFLLFSVVDGEINTQIATKRFVFSHWAQQIKLSEFGIKNFSIISPGLPVHRKNMQERKSLNSKKIKILFVGVWFERKGGRLLLDAYRQLSKSDENISLTILGQLPKDVKINSGERIRHHDFVSYKRLVNFYKTHDILVHIPPTVEGYGMAVPEAMSFGLACIVSNVCVLPEFIQNGVSGLVIESTKADLETALEKLISTKKLRQRLGNEAQKRFMKYYSLPRFQKKLQQLFIQATINNRS
jgi:glycosyltransferase involved in cell wall biosynthesis